MPVYFSIFSLKFSTDKHAIGLLDVKLITKDLYQFVCLEVYFSEDHNA